MPDNTPAVDGIEELTPEEATGQTFKFDAVANTKPGKALLRWLMNESGFLQSSMPRTRDGALTEGNVFYNEGRRMLYVELRQHLSPRIRGMIENEKDINHGRQPEQQPRQSRIQSRQSKLRGQ